MVCAGEAARPHHHLCRRTFAADLGVRTERLKPGSLVCERDGVEREVHISSQTKVWKGRDLPGTAALRPGD